MTAVEDYVAALVVIRSVYKQILDQHPELEQVLDVLETDVTGIGDIVTELVQDRAQSMGQSAIQVMIAEGTGILSVAQTGALLDLRYRLLTGADSGDFLLQAVADVQDLGQNPVPLPDFEARLDIADEIMTDLVQDVQSLVQALDVDAALIADIGQIVTQTGPAANYSPEAVGAYAQFFPVLINQNPSFYRVVSVVQYLQQQGLTPSEIAQELRGQEIESRDIYQRLSLLMISYTGLEGIFC